MTEEPIYAEPVDDITSDDKLWAALAYVFTPIVPIVIMLMEDKKDRPFIKAHNAQALAVVIIMYVIATVTVGCGSIVFFALWYWAYKAYQGEYVEIPFVTNFVKNQGWA